MPPTPPAGHLPTPHAGPRLRTALLGAGIGLAALAGCYEDPQVRMDQAQQATDMADAVNELNARTSELGFALDSLRHVVAKQDSTIWRLANLAGVPYQR
jgi:ferredoxin-NADP reductase